MGSVPFEIVCTSATANIGLFMLVDPVNAVTTLTLWNPVLSLKPYQSPYKGKPPVTQSMLLDQTSLFSL